jgi:uncharacterized protein
MRRNDKEITSPGIIENILKTAEICRLGLVDNNEAYIVPVNFAYHDGSIYIHSAGMGRKIEILQQNNQVAFELEGEASIQTGPKPCNWTTRYRSIMGKGKITIETDPDQKKQALDLIMKKYGWGNEELVYDDALISRVCILDLRIESLSGKQSGNWEEK